MYAGPRGDGSAWAKDDFTPLGDRVSYKVGGWLYGVYYGEKSSPRLSIAAKAVDRYAASYVYAMMLESAVVSISGAQMPNTAAAAKSLMHSQDRKTAICNVRAVYDHAELEQAYALLNMAVLNTPDKRRRYEELVRVAPIDSLEGYCDNNYSYLVLPKTHVFYLPGILSSAESAAAATEQLRHAYYSQYLADTNTIIEPALVNRSFGLWNDLAEVFALKMNLPGYSFMDAMLGAHAENIARLTGKATAEAANAASVDMAANLKTIKDTLALGADHNVIIVPHSEGNALALALKELAVKAGISPARITIVHVASPVALPSPLPVGSSNVLNSKDLVIKAAPGSPAPTFTPLPTMDVYGVDLTGHGFLAVYFNSGVLGDFNSVSQNLGAGSCGPLRNSSRIFVLGAIYKAAMSMRMPQFSWCN